MGREGQSSPHLCEAPWAEWGGCSAMLTCWGVPGASFPGGHSVEALLKSTNSCGEASHEANKQKQQILIKNKQQQQKATASKTNQQMWNVKLILLVQQLNKRHFLLN